MPLVSIILPLKGACPFLKDALASVFLQKFTDYEIIICKDSVDTRIENILIRLAKKYNNIKILETIGMNLPAALNYGVSICNGTYIARFDGDDIMLPNRLASQVNFLQNNFSYVACGGQIVSIDSFGNLLKSRSFYQIWDRSLKKNLLLKCPFPHPGSMIRKSVFLIEGGYNVNYSFAEDYELWVRLSKVGKFRNLNRPILGYRSYENQTSSVNRSQTIVHMLAVAISELNGRYCLKMSEPEYLDHKLLPILFDKLNLRQRMQIQRFFPHTDLEMILEHSLLFPTKNFWVRYQMFRNDFFSRIIRSAQSRILSWLHYRKVANYWASYSLQIQKMSTSLLNPIEGLIK